MEGLEEFAVANNNLEGSIPQTFSNLPKLKNFYIYGNRKIRGNIEPLMNIKTLEILSAWSCDLSGTIPNSIGDITNLRLISFRNNSFTGTIPPSIGNLEKLYFLDLAINKISGTIPSQLGSLKNLTTFYLHENNIGGTIPPIFDNFENLTHLSLYGNRLTGELPDSIYDLKNLEGLWLSNNNLTGTISDRIGNLENLILFFIQNNQFYGTIPEELGNMPFLFYIDLSSNKFSGTIPDFNQILFISLRLNNLCVEGCPPSVPNIFLNDCEMKFTPFDDDCDFPEVCSFYSKSVCSDERKDIIIDEQVNITSEIVFKETTVKINVSDFIPLVMEEKTCEHKNHFYHPSFNETEVTNTTESCSCVIFEDATLYVDMNNKKIDKGDEFEIDIAKGCSKGTFNNIEIRKSTDEELCFTKELVNDKNTHMLLKVKAKGCKSSKWWISLVVIGVIGILAAGVIVLAMFNDKVKNVIYPFRRRKTSIPT